MSARSPGERGAPLFERDHGLLFGLAWCFFMGFVIGALTHAAVAPAPRWSEASAAEPAECADKGVLCWDAKRDQLYVGVGDEALPVSEWAKREGDLDER